MDSDGLHASDEESAARELVRQAALLVENSGDLPRGFVAALFGRAAAEDLIAYSAREIAARARCGERTRIESTAGRRHEIARSRHGHRDLQRRHAVSARFDIG